MDDLIEFLRARLAEDEAVARAAAEPAPGLSPSDPVEFVIGGNDLSTPATVAADAHIRRFAPARALVEVEAKRDLLRVAEAAADFAPTFTTGVAAKLEDVLRGFAAAYREHPDYRPEWAPDA